jgi:uncharacterized protein YjbJ (UPF0337 family)
MQMNWDRIEGNWKQIKGEVKQQWGRITDDQLDVIAGKREHLAGRIQEAYGLTRDEAEQQLADWQRVQQALPSFNKGKPGFKHNYSIFKRQEKS